MLSGLPVCLCSVSPAHPQLSSCLLVLSLVSGQWCWVEEPADSLGGDAGRLKASVHESAQLWRSCQLETTQRHLEYVPQGHCVTEEGGRGDQTDLAWNPGATTLQLCDDGRAT